MSVVLTAVDDKHANPIWPAMGYPGQPPPFPLNARAHRQCLLPHPPPSPPPPLVPCFLLLFELASAAWWFSHLRPCRLVTIQHCWLMGFNCWHNWSGITVRVGHCGGRFGRLSLYQEEMRQWVRSQRVMQAARGGGRGGLKGHAGHDAGFQLCQRRQSCKHCHQHAAPVKQHIMFF